MSRPSCWHDCNGCGCCQEYKEYNGEEETDWSRGVDIEIDLERGIEISKQQQNSQVILICKETEGDE